MAHAPEGPDAPEEIVEIAFRIAGGRLPTDHAWALRSAVVERLPWMENEPAAGIHPIHGAASGNGWERPDDASGQWLLLSHRTSLKLRIPARRAPEAKALCGHRLDLDMTRLDIGEARVRPLAASPTLFARHLLDEDSDATEAKGDDDEGGNESGDEERFIARWRSSIEALTHRSPRTICGLRNRIKTPTGALPTRSLLIADLDIKASIAIRRHGFEEDTLLGCGLFIPHKSIDPIANSTASR